MITYLIRRILSTLPVAAIVGIFVFALLHLAPGDPAATIAGEGATSQDIARIHADLGLDDPIWFQFWLWLNHLLHGDLGVSIYSKAPVMTLVLQRVEPTLALSVLTLIISVSVGVPLGVLAAARAGSWLDHLVITLAVVGYSAPVFVIGYILVMIFSLSLGWLPVQGYTPLSDGFFPFLEHLILPAVTLSFAYIALIARFTRASVIEVLDQDYVLTAYAKGFNERQVITRHVLRNAAVPIVTIIGIGVALLIGGVVVTESVFNIPGVGRLVLDAISRRDYPVIQGVTLVFSGVYVLINLLVDLCCALFDPRIRL